MLSFDPYWEVLEIFCMCVIKSRHFSCYRFLNANGFVKTASGLVENFAVKTLFV